MKTTDGRRFVNFGLCYFGADTSDPCSSSKLFNFEWCRQKVCNVCASGESAASCLSDAETNACAATFAKTNTECTNHDRNLIAESCSASGDVVQTVCGPNDH